MNLWLGTTKKKKKKSYLQADGEILENSRKHRKNILLGIFTTFYFEILSFLFDMFFQKLKKC